MSSWIHAQENVSTTGAQCDSLARRSYVQIGAELGSGQPIILKR